MRFINKKTALVFILLLAVGHVRAQDAITIDSILHAIKNQNPLLRSYELRGNAISAYADGAKGWMAPEAGGGLWMVPYRKTEDARDKGQIMLSVQQRISNPAKLKANQKFLRSKQIIETENKNAAFNELKAKARLSWYQWKVLEKKKKVLKESEVIVTRMLSIAQARYPYNQGKLGAIYKAEARLEEVRNLIFMNDNEILQKNIELNQLMNIPSDVRFKIDTMLHLESLIVGLSDTTSFSRRRSDIRSLDRSIESVRLNQDLERTQLKPDFNLSFSHMIPRGAGMPSQFMLLGMVTIPIAPWTSRSYKSNADGMGKEIEALKSERAALVSEASAATAGILAATKTRYQQIQNYDKKILPILKRNYEVTMIGYQENKEELPEVLDAWEAVNAGELVYLETVSLFFEGVVGYWKVVEE